MVLLRSLFNSQWDIRGVVLQLQINKTMKGAIVVPEGMAVDKKNMSTSSSVCLTVAFLYSFASTTLRLSLAPVEAGPSIATACESAFVH